MDDTVLVAGGGLAGLSCALSLGRAGFDVTLFESASELGGKAGARKPREGERFPAAIEHGPHFFAAWYRNLLSLMDRIGTDGHLVGYDGYHFLLPSQRLSGGTEGGTARASASLSFLAGLVADGDAGPLTWTTAVRGLALALDLLTARERPALDEISLTGYVHSRWYGDAALAALADEQVRRATVVPAPLVSTQTMSRLLRLWFRHPRPLLSVLDTDLASGVIEPLASEAAKVANVNVDTPVDGLVLDDDRIAGLRLASGEELRGAATVSAVPVEVIQRWLNDRVGAADPRLMALQRLRTAPMACVQLAFDRSVGEIPPGVIYLAESRPLINLIDLSQVWRSLAGGPGTVLSLVLPDYDQLRGLSQERQLELVLDELERYFPSLADASLTDAIVQQHVDRPRFMHTVGVWSSRPSPEQAYGAAPESRGGLYVCGDWTQTPIDLACMESAVLSGLLTAAALAKRYGREPGIQPLLPAADGRLRRASYRLAKLVSAPLAAAGKLAER